MILYIYNIEREFGGVKWWLNYREVLNISDGGGDGNGDYICGIIYFREVILSLSLVLIGVNLY